MDDLKLPTLYKKSSTGKIEQWEVFVSQKLDGRCHVNSTFGEVDGKMQTTFDTITEGKNIGKSNETSVYEQACKEAKSKWEKKKKKGYVESIEAAQAGEVDDLIEGGIEPMLAHVYEKHGDKIVFPCLAQPKLDGIRCIAIKKGPEVTLWSRTRKRITSCPHIEDAIKLNFAHIANIILDGELYVHSYKQTVEVPLTKGKVALISPEDYEEISKHKWSYLEGGYAVRNQRENGKSNTIYMHRQLLGFPEGYDVDHINHNTLDNTRENLRLCSPSENAANQTKRNSNTSGFKGVHFFKRDGTWQAQITFQNKKIHLGYFTTPEEASKVYEEAAIKYFGDYAFKKERVPFEQIVSAVRKEDPSPESQLIEYHIYDMVDLQFTTKERINYLDSHVVRPPLKVLWTLIVNNQEDVAELFKRHTKAGYEGVMLRNMNAKYENKRSYNLQKVKEFEDSEFEIVGVVEGKGKLQGLLGAFLCRTQDGTEFEVKMTGNQEETKKFLNDPTLCVGKLLTVQYQGLTGKNKVPRFPVGLRIREEGL